MQQILVNFMDLISAVLLANTRTTSSQSIAGYNHYIFKYMSESRKIYPDVTVKPVDHAALHLGAMLKDFGPVHSHSSPYYERYINFLRRINTNRKSGK